MSDILCKLFIGANIGFSLFNMFWFIAVLNSKGFTVPAVIFGLASYFHLSIAILVHEKLQKDKADDEKSK